MKISIFIPLYNEIENLDELYRRITEVGEKIACDYEVIMVNDGSDDGTKEALDRIAQKDFRIKVIHFKKNCGQTAAMMAGIDYATGDILVPMDGDLQNDPADIPRLIDKLEEGYDVCSGWRKNRKDNSFWRVIPSKIANWIISKVSGVSLHDTGCSLKAYRCEVIKNIKLYGEMHRFIPIYASWEGAKVTEIEVNHSPRKHGKSNYGIERAFKVVLDLMVVKFFAKFLQKPMYVFGGFGLFNFLLSFIAFIWMTFYKFGLGVSFSKTPLPLAIVGFFLIGFMSIFTGLTSEILIRTYYESQNKSVYKIKEIKNL